MPVLNPVLIKAVLVLLGVSVVLSPIPLQYQQSNTDIVAVDNGEHYEVIIPVNKDEALLTFLNKNGSDCEEVGWNISKGMFYIDKNGKKLKEYQEDGFGVPNEPWKNYMEFWRSLTPEEQETAIEFGQKCNENMEQLQKELKKSSIKSRVQKSWFNK